MPKPPCPGWPVAPFSLRFRIRGPISLFGAAGPDRCHGSMDPRGLPSDSKRGFMFRVLLGRILVQRNCAEGIKVAF
jgi:hypothetical protein